MKWIGQHIWDFISRFRSDVYLEDLSTTTESNVLVVDSDGKVSKNTSVGGDITSVIGGTNCTVSGGTSGDATVNVDDAFLINDGSDTTTGTITAGGFTVGTTVITDDSVAMDSGIIDCSGTAELAGTTVTLDSAGAVTFERGSSTVEVPDVAGTLQVVDLVKYILPSDFIVDDEAFVRGYLYAADNAGPNYGGTWQDRALEAYAWYQIPKGFKITHMHARGSVTTGTDCSIYQLDPTDGTIGAALASGVWGTNRSLSTAITSANDAVALIELDIDAATDIIYSVMLTLAEV